MKQSTPETQLDSTAVSAGRNAVTQELTQARAALDEAAYRAALHPGDAKAREALVQARQRVQQLTDELDGIDAVGRVVQAQERNQGRQRAVAEVRQQADDADAAIAQFASAYDKASTALLAAIEAITGMQDAERVARAACVNVAGLAFAAGDPLSGGTVLLRERWAVSGCRLLDANGARSDRTPEYFDDAKVQLLDRARWLVKQAAEAKIASIEAAGRPQEAVEEDVEPVEPLSAHPDFPGQVGLITDVIEHTHYAA